MIREIILLILSLWTIIDGIYIPAIDYIVCDNPIMCAHEAGHRLDRSLDYPSQTIEFKSVVDDNWPIVLENTTCIIESEKCLYSEAYARIWGIGLLDNFEMFPEFIGFYE